MIRNLSLTVFKTYRYYLTLSNDLNMLLDSVFQFIYKGKWCHTIFFLKCTMKIRKITEFD